MLVENNNEKMPLDDSNTIRSIGLDEFEEKVLKESKPVLVLCIHQDSEFQEQIHATEDAYRTYTGRIKVYLLEDETLRTFKERFTVKGTPTFLLFVNGSVKGRILGRVDSKDLKDFLFQMLHQ